MKLANLESLRAIAAINVVVYHAIGVVTKAAPAGVFAPLAGWGANGVDIFFVLSGFVITLSQFENPKTPFRFLVNRLIRIAPNYWAWTLLLFAALVAAPHMFPRLHADPMHLAGSVLFVSQPLLGKEPVFYVGWTLEYEMLFYVIFWVSLQNIVQSAGRFFVPGVLIGLILVTGVPLVALEFLFGIVIAEAFRAQRPMLPPSWTFGIGVVGLCSSILVGMPADRFFVWGIPAALLVHGAVFLPQLKMPLLEYLGKASYSIYLVQVITIPVAGKLATLLFGPLPADLLILAMVGATILGGAVNYQIMERPVSRWLGMLGSKHA